MTRLPLPVARLFPPAAAEPADRLRFDLRELSGSLGDLGTFLPLSVAMALVCGMDLGLIFIFAGLMNMATGWWFRQPIPVQPMKAIAAVAIAEGLSTGAIAAAGMVMGVAVFSLAIVGGVDQITRRIPKPVVRGIQAGVGIKLAWTGLSWLAELPVVGWDSWTVALAVGLVVAWALSHPQPVLLGIFVTGFALLGLEHPGAYREISLQWPVITLTAPSTAEWWNGLTLGAIPQLPLTLLNSVIAVCALSADYFPGRGARPKRMAASVGLMNLLCVPWGGMPMCHGSGGLAAQYRFGARTGGSVILLGAMKIAAGLLLGGALLGALAHYPASILAVMVTAAGGTLSGAARDSLRGRAGAIVVSMAAAILIWNTLAGFLVGCLLAAAFALVGKAHRNEP